MNISCESPLTPTRATRRRTRSRTDSGWVPERVGFDIALFTLERLLRCRAESVERSDGLPLALSACAKADSER
jgi:hypothetical protein